MSEKQETIDDHVAATKNFSRMIPPPYGKRIESAAMRMGVGVSKTETTTHGNAAKMREALVKIRKSCHKWIDFGTIHKKTFEHYVEWIDSVLSEPPRNCDVGTAEEQTDRFKDLCRKYRRGSGPRANCKGCPIQHESLHVGCTFAWAETPYAESEAGK